MYHFAIPYERDQTAKSLILSVMNTTGTTRQSIGQLIHSAEPFGIEAVAIRVAATRMLKEGLLTSPERGVYEVGSKAWSLNRRVRKWEMASERQIPWNGDWLMVLTHFLGRADRKQVRTGERAMNLSGYREAYPGVWVRPANLAASLEEHRTDLVGLGADERLVLLRSAAISHGEHQDWSELWAVDVLENSYREAIAVMTESLERLETLDAASAARETFLLGQAVIRAINYDPLLPEQMCDHSLFIEMVRAMKLYNKAGRSFWYRYSQTAGYVSGNG